MRAASSIVILVCLVATASAEERTNNVAISTNLPFGWDRTHAVSLFAGVAKHHAIRANVARYYYDPGIAGALISAVAGAEDEGSYAGQTVDLGLAYVLYPRRVLSGPMLEVGALLRSRDTKLTVYSADHTRTMTKTASYAGRVMVGWSWTAYDHFFVALAVGASVGRETGKVTYEDEYPRPGMPMITTTTEDIDRRAIVPEAYLRIGGSFRL